MQVSILIKTLNALQNYPELTPIKKIMNLSHNTSKIRYVKLLTFYLIKIIRYWYKLIVKAQSILQNICHIQQILKSRYNSLLILIPLIFHWHKRALPFRELQILAPSQIRKYQLTILLRTMAIENQCQYNSIAQIKFVQKMIQNYKEKDQAKYKGKN